MKRIFKYPVPVDDSFSLELPIGSHILCVQMQKSEPVMWIECNPDAIKTVRYFYLFGTGMEVSEKAVRYIGTIQMLAGGLIFHLFEGEK